jgi:two-component system chemotaxis sensor kinase CheA
MEMDDIDLSLLLQTFEDESLDLLAGVEASLLVLERSPDDSRHLASILRAIHTIKGNAKIVQLEHVSEFAHVTEDLLVDLREDRLQAGKELITLLLDAVDALREMVPAAITGANKLTTAQQELMLAMAKTRQGDTTAIAEPAAEPLDASVSISSRSSRTLRVGIDKLDKVMNLVGEIAIARGRVTEMLERGEELTRHEILEAHHDADLLHMELQEQVMKMRMVPVGPLFREYARAVRDTAISLDKKAELTIEGEDVEVDTTVVEHLRDPLTHMVRNAIHHGVEVPAERLQRGKSPVGQIRLSARHDAGFIVIEVTDDGAGLATDKILAQARALGLVASDEILSESQIFDFVFEPGFSTTDEVTEVSGRGVGMDVVRRNIELLRGSVAIESEPGEGSTVTMRLPLTLAIIDGFRVGVGDETYVVPLDSVVECLELPADASMRADGRGVIQLRDKPLPFLKIRSIFDLGGAAASRRENIIVVRHDSLEAGLAVDRLYGEAQTVIKPLNKLFEGIPGLAGTAIMGNGRVAFVLDVPGLLRRVFEQEAEESGGT